jgi:MFS family permease
VDLGLITSFALLCGIGSGGFFALQSSVVAQVIGLHRLERGIGWLELAASFGFLAGPISAGALLDAFGGTTKGAAPYRPVIVSLYPNFLGSAIQIDRKSGS